VDLLIGAAASAVEYVWSYQRNCGKPLWTVAEAMTHLGLPPDSDVPLVRQIAAALESRRQRLVEPPFASNLAEGIMGTLELAVPEEKRGTAAAAKFGSKQRRRDALVAEIKREVHERLLSLKSAIKYADDVGTIFPLPRLTQKELAAAVGASEPSVSRAIAESKDLELKIMLQTIKDPDLIRAYSR
jgi:hypothetical protein